MSGRCGVLGPVSCAEVPGSYFSKLQFAASALAPAVSLTVLLVIALALVAEYNLLDSVVAWVYVVGPTHPSMPVPASYHNRSRIISQWVTSISCQRGKLSSEFAQ